MPGFDRTGPLGQGPLTGRGLGPCGRGFARGCGFGAGLGMGFRRLAPSTYAQPQLQYTKKDELADLKADKELIERDLKAVEERIKELEKEK